MKTDEIIAGLLDLAKDRESFFREDGDDEVFRHDYAVLLGAISIIESCQWTPVSEDLPKEPYGCLVIIEVDDYKGEPKEVLLPYYAGYDGQQWNDEDGCIVRPEITRWMRLPNAPEKLLRGESE
ncbi:MAG: DUF551 domain-containing protein [Oscillospiraceae bacterium]|jgi:hypothetical protein|nr:DUF551 domain-containing protein [Oscillospiraceae bacterium]